MVETNQFGVPIEKWVRALGKKRRGDGQEASACGQLVVASWRFIFEGRDLDWLRPKAVNVLASQMDRLGHQLGSAT